jgi:hypothetical protein
VNDRPHSHRPRRGDTAVYERPPEPPRFAHAPGRAQVRPPLRVADTGELPAQAPEPRIVPVAVPLRFELLLWMCALMLIALVLSAGWMVPRLWRLERAVEAPIVLTTPTTSATP